jgi:hypothetical protein
MGWVRVKKKSISRMTLQQNSFAQQWDKGFEEELSSLRSSCKTSSVIDGPLVQSTSREKGAWFERDRLLFMFEEKMGGVLKTLRRSSSFDIM